MLFVDHRETETMECDAVLDQRVRADHDVRAAVGDRSESSTLLRGG